MGDDTLTGGVGDDSIVPDDESPDVLELRSALAAAEARIAQLDPADPNKNRFNVLAELTRLRRAACDPRLP